MSTQLKEMPKVSRPGRKPTHPYDKWFEEAAKEGGILLKEGEDFTCSVRTMRHNLYRNLNLRNLNYETVVVDDDKVNGIALRIKGKKPLKVGEKK